MLLEAADLRDDARSRTRAVVAVGCLAERYGVELAEQLPEADAVLGFDAYADLATHLDGILHGRRPAAHVPRDRRSLLPLAPTDRPSSGVAIPVTGTGGPATSAGSARRGAPATTSRTASRRPAARGSSAGASTAVPGPR